LKKKTTVAVAVGHFVKPNPQHIGCFKDQNIFITK